jgi:hypothetical protein
VSAVGGVAHVRSSSRESNGDLTIFVASPRPVPAAPRGCGGFCGDSGRGCNGPEALIPPAARPRSRRSLRHGGVASLSRSFCRPPCSHHPAAARLVLRNRTQAAPTGGRSVRGPVNRRKPAVARGVTLCASGIRPSHSTAASPEASSSQPPNSALQPTVARCMQHCQCGTIRGGQRRLNAGPLGA